MNQQHNENTSESREQRNDNYKEEPRSADSQRARRNSRLPYKSPALAMWLSTMPGLGQVYVGNYILGFQYMAVMAFTILILSSGPGSLSPFFGIFLGFFWIYNIIDAHRRANAYNRTLDGLAPDQLVEQMKMPNAKGSVPTGIVLVAIGGLIFLDLNFGISLEWLEDLWPLGLVAMGGWLILKGKRG